MHYGVFFSFFSFLLCIILMLHKHLSYSMIFSSGNSELLSCKSARGFLFTEFHLSLNLQFLVSEIQYQKSEIWAWVTAAITYSKHKLLWASLQKKSVKQDTITSCLMTQISLLIICSAISKTNICSEYVWIFFSQLFLPQLYDSVIEFLAFIYCSLLSFHPRCLLNTANTLSDEIESSLYKKSYPALSCNFLE